MAIESYAYEKFMVAVDGMATSLAGIRDRLYGAYLNFMTVTDELRVLKVVSRRLSRLCLIMTA